MTAVDDLELALIARTLIERAYSSVTFELVATLALLLLEIEEDDRG